VSLFAAVLLTKKSSNIWKKILVNQNYIQEKIKSRLNPGNACYHAVRNFFVSQFAIQKFED